MVHSEIAPTNLRALLEQRVSAAPDKLFLFSEADGRQFTYAEFDAAVNRTVNMLAGSCVSKGDVVSLLLLNSAEYLIAYFACWKLGAVAGPINSMLKTEEIAYIMGNSESKALLYNSEFLSTAQEVTKLVDTVDSMHQFDHEGKTY
jgi:acyl-CoA synthetase (AMP-forming)/AMP-acid ligase II